MGIDIEKIGPPVAFEGIESHDFSPKERAELETLPQDLRPRGFFDSSFAGPAKKPM